MRVLRVESEPIFVRFLKQHLSCSLPSRQRNGGRRASAKTAQQRLSANRLPRRSPQEAEHEVGDDSVGQPTAAAEKKPHGGGGGRSAGHDASAYRRLREGSEFKVQG